MKKILIVIGLSSAMLLTACHPCHRVVGAAAVGMLTGAVITAAATAPCRTPTVVTCSSCGCLYTGTHTCAPVVVTPPVVAVTPAPVVIHDSLFWGPPVRIYRHHGYRHCGTKIRCGSGSHRGGGSHRR